MTSPHRYIGASLITNTIVDVLFYDLMIIGVYNIPQNSILIIKTLKPETLTEPFKGTPLFLTNLRIRPYGSQT